MRFSWILFLCCLLWHGVECSAENVRVTYSFEQGKAADDSGQYEGVMRNDARLVKMKDGNHALFTGVEGGYMNLGQAIGNDVVGKLGGDFSISVDVLLSSLDNSLDKDGNFLWAFSSQQANGNPANYVMMRVRNNALGYTMRYGTGNYRVESRSSLETGVWHNLTLVHEGLRTTLYVDGQVLAEKNYSDNPEEGEQYISPVMMYEQAGSLNYNYIGKSMWTGNTVLHNAFVDNLCIEDRAMTQEEVEDLWQTTAGLATESDEVKVTDPREEYDFNTHDGVVTLITEVNRTWQKRMGWNTKSFWNWAVYHNGNMAAYHYLTDQETEQAAADEFLDFSMQWAQRNNWQGSTGDNPREWKYNYGEGSNYALFGDWQCCFQTYIDLYDIARENNPQEDYGYMVNRALFVMDYMAESDTIDYWWWADALYMALPVMPKMYRLTGDEKYLQKMYDCFVYARNLMYDEERHLFFRDKRYIYPAHMTTRGLPDFWSRGNGWVVAGLAKVLQLLPEEWEHYGYFKDIYLEMCKAVADCQTEEGFWTESLIDPLFATCRESSGTCLFTFGLLWGINNGLLAEEEFLPTVERAWQYITQIALQANWTVGYMQPIGAEANENAQLYPSNVTDFGTGAFLLAASEMGRHIDRELEPEPDGIEREALRVNREANVYDLTGRHVTDKATLNSKSIYLQHGKKHIKP